MPETSLIGRGEDLTRVYMALTRRVVGGALITGATRIGKTALVDDFAALVEAKGYAVLRAPGGRREGDLRPRRCVLGKR